MTGTISAGTSKRSNSGVSSHVGMVYPLLHDSSCISNNASIDLPLLSLQESDFGVSAIEFSRLLYTSLLHRSSFALHDLRPSTTSFIQLLNSVVLRWRNSPS